ncbi:DNA polymerase-3 subunit epsilon [Nonlabens xylanidelens]|uniref:DNA polymerase-3 subunit epsilon n=1 Tax=Nonlabens xylanidelens TaxID=191564 RepID=A0A2S6IMK9_9FLAO|nr:exonuclease domain-containing protein [Nonlabens xylanidelens]PPK95474.1 DNA polymerase-3 subunit epsilon [Nonlabens xylanidelens]PQJ22290.1 exonuclease [Nonlabens xylanidelens]
MYAIVDVETTGGKYNEEGITEVAIYKFDGHEIIDQFASLVNPEKEIQPFVVKLTGINNAMLKRAPKFYEVAKRIIEITEGTTLVAHNAGFDHRMLRLEFDRLGYEFERPTLCTVELAQSLLPDQDSYNLGKLTRSLGIPLTDRHRATGDALATVKLFKLLLQKDINKEIISKSLKHFKPLKIEPNLKAIVDQLPAATGVFYVYDVNGTIIFISKSKNIKKRVTQLFTGSNKKSKEIQKKVAEITFEKTGSEMISILKEHIEIRKHTPALNGRIKRNNFSHGLYIYYDTNQTPRFFVKSVVKDPNHIITFSSSRSGYSFLEKLEKKYGTSVKFRKLPHNDASLSIHQNTAVTESLDLLNETVNEIITTYSLKATNKILVDKGREASERSVILIENGRVTGYAFVNLRIQMTDIKMLKSLLTPIEDHGQVLHLVASYIRHKKIYQIIDL